MLCNSLFSNTVPPNSTHTWISLFLAVFPRLWVLLSLSCSLHTASRGSLGICRDHIIYVTFLSNHNLPLLFVQYLKVIISYIWLCGLLPMVYEYLFCSFHISPCSKLFYPEGPKWIITIHTFMHSFIHSLPYC